jgi:hypothetical protein
MVGLTVTNLDGSRGTRQLALFDEDETTDADQA